MRVQTFSGRTAEAAFERVRRALGDSAVILEVKPQAVGVEVHATGGQSRAGLMRLLNGHRPRPHDAGWRRRCLAA